MGKAGSAHLFAPGKVTEGIGGGAFIGGVRRFPSGVRPEIASNAVDANDRPVVAAPFVEVDTFRKVAALTQNAVSVVLALRGQPKVDHSIVGFYPVDVVDLPMGMDSMMKQPRNSMRFESTLLDAHDQISLVDQATGGVACSSDIATVALPMKQAAIGVISEYLARDIQRKRGTYDHSHAPQVSQQPTRENVRSFADEPSPKRQQRPVLRVINGKCLPRETPMRGPRNSLGRHLQLVWSR